MKTINLFGAGIALLLITACNPSVNVDPLIPLSPSSKDWPEYSEQNLSGKVFGQDWKALTAVARPFGQEGKEMSLEFYPEIKTKACTSSQMSSKPYATVVIPANYSLTEYVADMNVPGTGNPMMFSMLAGESKNLMATKTKIRVNSITASGLNVSIYAQGTDADGIVSEINGAAAVVDCAKAVDFSVWDDLAGWYTLQKFDGVSVEPRTSILRFTNNRFYHRDTKSYLNTLVFPLYSSVGKDTDMSSDFGPMENVGTTTVSSNNGVKTYTYSYHGPMNAKGLDVTVNLDMTVVKSGNALTVNYTLEVPNYIAKTSHNFALTK